MRDRTRRTNAVLKALKPLNSKILEDGLFGDEAKKALVTLRSCQDADIVRNILQSIERWNRDLTDEIVQAGVWGDEGMFAMTLFLADYGFEALEANDLVEGPFEGDD